MHLTHQASPVDAPAPARAIRHGAALLALLFAAQAAMAQTHGSYCQTSAGGCVVAVPQPLGSYCTCGGVPGTITG